jgi:hypothetical protein
VRKFVYENSLSLFFFLILVAALVAQAFVGHDAYNEEQLAHHSETISLGRYLTSSAFGRAVMENWQSEYLQFTLFILATVWLLQKGSPESKELGEEGLESDQKQRLGGYGKENSPTWAQVGGMRRTLYSNSLLIVMGLIFIGSWFAHSVTSWSDYNSEQLQHGEQSLSWLRFVGTSHFWEQTLQNWQSEFLAIGSMAVFAIYLRQRGSPESKPVGSPHEATGVES